jgi:mannose-1-phosphate guanylyltransferase/mannose-6-phosphate isomerase
MYPKQLLPLAGTQTLLQQTARRLEGMPHAAGDCLVVCNEAHRFLVAQQLQEIGVAARIVLEPEGRNTAPAVGLAAFLVAQKDPRTILLVMPADHVIEDSAAFQAAVTRGIEAASADTLVTFGIVPDRPETGYGYIEATPDGDNAVAVTSFVEKPDVDTARAYLSGGKHFWNSGMFLFSASAYLESLQEFAPKMHEICGKSIENCDTGEDFVRPDAETFRECPSDSIDYAVMEKSRNVAMLPLDAGWNDVGSWAALHDIRAKDASGNTVRGDVVLHDCSGIFVDAESRLVTAVGLEDVIIVETKDSTLVASKEKSQDVKALVDALKAKGREETKLHRQVYRPWGSYDSIDSEDGFQVKRLIVNPGAVLSLQKHARRAEHWVVV